MPDSLALEIANRRAVILAAVTAAISEAQIPNTQAAWFLAELGVSRQDYDRMTPADTAAAVAAWKEKQAREDERTARICWAVNLASGIPKADGSPWTVADFIPRPPLTPEQQAAFLTAKFQVMAGALAAREKQDAAGK